MVYSPVDVFDAVKFPDPLSMLPEEDTAPYATGSMRVRLEPDRRNIWFVVMRLEAVSVPFTSRVLDGDELCTPMLPLVSINRRDTFKLRSTTWKEASRFVWPLMPLLCSVQR